jgi:hypothetical protein
MGVRSMIVIYSRKAYPLPDLKGDQLASAWCHSAPHEHSLNDPLPVSVVGIIITSIISLPGPVS